MIQLPYPPKILWPNGPVGNRYAKAREKKKHTEWAYHAMLAAIPRCYRHNGDRIRVTYVVRPHIRGPLPDKDNCIAAAKAYQDGIALAMGVNDNLFDEPQILFGERVKGGAFIVEMG